MLPTAPHDRVAVITASILRGGFPAFANTSDYIVADGIHLRVKRRDYTRGPERPPILDMLMVCIDIAPSLSRNGSH